MPSSYPEKPRRPLTPAERSRFHLRSLRHMVIDLEAAAEVFPEDDLTQKEVETIRKWARARSLYWKARQRAAASLGVYFAEVR